MAGLPLNPPPNLALDRSDLDAVNVVDERPEHDDANLIMTKPEFGNQRFSAVR